MLRTGTQIAIKDNTKTKKDYVNVALNVFFAYSSFKSIFTQLHISYRWFYYVPFISLILFAKEIFGFAVFTKPAIKILIKKPEKSFNECMNNAFDPDYGFLSFISLPENIQSKLSSVIYVFMCLSNTRALFSNLICAKYDIAKSYMGQEVMLQKIGNIMVLVFDLVVKTHDDSPEMDYHLFRGLMFDILMLCFSHYLTTASMSTCCDFLQ